MTEAHLPAAPAYVGCPQCAAQLPSYDPANSRWFGCPACGTYFEADPTADGSAGRPLRRFQQPVLAGPALRLGAVAELGGYRCRVVGYQVRSEQRDKAAEWREYQLRPAAPTSGDDPADFPLQLAEYEGHWLLVRRAPRSLHNIKVPRAARNWQYVDETDGHSYRLWHRYRPLVRNAQGEFDWHILDDEQLHVEELVSPPYLLVREQSPATPPAWYRDEYLPREAVARAFSLTEAVLPAQVGVAAAQPGPAQNWPALRRLFWVVVGLLTLGQVALLASLEPTLTAQDFAVAAPGPGGSSRVLVSRSFALGRRQALEVTLGMPGLLNHWAEVTASLVNEETGQGYEFTRSLEHYEGVEGGEHWSEGDLTAEAVLGAVPAGRYHFNLYPTLDAGTGPVRLQLRVEQDAPLWSNYLLVLAGLALVPLWVWWGRESFERSRWENSNYSPYSSS